MKKCCVKSLNEWLNRKGRARYHCAECDKNLTMEAVYLTDAWEEIILINK